MDALFHTLKRDNQCARESPTPSNGAYVFLACICLVAFGLIFRIVRIIREGRPKDTCGSDISVARYWLKDKLEIVAHLVGIYVCWLLMCQCDAWRALFEICVYRVCDHLPLTFEYQVASSQFARVRVRLMICYRHILQSARSQSDVRGAGVDPTLASFVH